MANLIRIKRSAVSGKIPSTADLDLGELAVNTYDGKIYLKKDNGSETVVEIGAAKVITSATLPLAANAGDLWWDPTSGFLKVYYEGADSSQWVDASGGVVGDTGFTGSQGNIGFTGSRGATATVTSSLQSATTEINVSYATAPTVGQVLMATGSESATWQTQIINFIHEQAIPSSTWIISHNLGKFPSITVVDSALTIVVGDITYNDDHTLTVVFLAPFAGKAYLN